MVEPVPQDLFEAEMKALCEKIEAADRLYGELRKSDKQAVETALAAAEKAVAAAFEAAKEKSLAHNDLIRAMDRQQKTFVTKGQVYSAILTAIAVLGLAVTYFANFGS